MKNSPLARLDAIYHEFPRPFWTLVLATFIDRLGGFILFPFFALYVTRRFDVGMTTVGLLFAIFSAASFIGSALGGALADKMGRKRILIFSLVATSLSSIMLGFAASIEAFYFIVFFVGILTETGGPAHQAMTADLLPEKQRAQGYGILRVAFNVSAALGPAIGGFVAARSYLALFIIDAIISLVTAALVFFALPETLPQPQGNVEQPSMGAAFMGYLQVLRDKVFLLFILAGIFAGLAYMNLNATLGVFLRDVHGVPEQGYGYLLTLNALMVVAMQFWITRRIEERPPMRMMAFGTLLYAIGFAMFGFISAYGMFMVAIVIITVGEMIIAPIAQALVAKFSPEDMRGRYMAVHGISWGIPFAVGPYLAGLIMDSPLNPNLLWYASGVAGLISAAGYLYLQRRMRPEPAGAGA
jgi:MFS family permease